MHATSTSGQVQAGVTAAPSSTSKLVFMDGALDYCFSPAHVGACMQFSFRSGFLSTREVNSTRWNAGQVAAGVAQLHGLSSNRGHRTRELMDPGAVFLGAAAVPAYCYFYLEFHVKASAEAWSDGVGALALGS